ncbi:uncharacterized protein EAF01_002765 [Botrytis porri]|uniref:uncharacterized protein n=1 Tax=Botrytis porri TaxID=87229 RepID=UPI001900972B|nr:uncharacterized protein EAF01_002765 [Botrytis porri]KAF7911258.1 hypothetical protein EAF01_002765 [Botrytis porri]
MLVNLSASHRSINKTSDAQSQRYILSLDLNGLMQIVQNEPRYFYQKVSSGYKLSTSLHELDLRILNVVSYQYKIWNTIKYFDAGVKTQYDRKNQLPADRSAEPPEVEKVHEISGLGVSAWTTKSRISTLLKDGINQDYYLKTTVGDLNRAAINGEFESMKAIKKVIPGFIASPIAQGSMKNESDCHLYRGQYLSIIGELVEPCSFCE